MSKKRKKEKENICPHKNLFIADFFLFIIASKMRITHMSINGRMDKQNVVYLFLQWNIIQP